MARHILVSGRVQGVGFRFRTQQTALACNLVGWVRNNPDGTVEMEIAGSESDMDSFLSEVKSGFNNDIQVTEVHVDTVSKTAHDYNDFSIKR